MCLHFGHFQYILTDSKEYHRYHFFHGCYLTTGSGGRILLVISFGKEKSLEKPVLKEVNFDSKYVRFNLVLLLFEYWSILMLEKEWLSDLHISFSDSILVILTFERFTVKLQKYYLQTMASNGELDIWWCKKGKQFCFLRDVCFLFVCFNSLCVPVR